MVYNGDNFTFLHFNDFHIEIFTRIEKDRQFINTFSGNQCLSCPSDPDWLQWKFSAFMCKK